jgi:bifunctional enzyme CysN/CysC
VELTLQSDLAFDLADHLPSTSRFVIVDQYEITGGGIILSDIADVESQVRDSVFQRNLRWIRGGVTLEQRQERYSQRPALVLITGKQGVGRKRLAQALETKLFQAGRLVYYLGFGSVIYGVDADLKRNNSLETRFEHIRRLAEVAHILLDTGHILVLTAVELTQEDLSLLKTVITPEFIETVWVGEEVTTNIRFDLRIEALDDVDSAVTQIRSLLQEHGVVFRV